ncbi:hypothetical protein K2P56_01075 [Patescibacteria group bacterium]|nr:hypothetical protein [Patescibacteria group bacterium]
MATEKIALTPDVVVKIVAEARELGGVDTAHAATLILSDILNQNAQLGTTLVSHSFDAFADAVGRNAD